MQGLTSELLARAFRIFRELAYPNGAVPAHKALYFHMSPDQPLDVLLVPPVCQACPGEDGEIRKCAFRLGPVAKPALGLGYLRSA